MQAGRNATTEQLTSWAISAAQHRREYEGRGEGDGAMQALCKALLDRDQAALDHFEVFDR
jgi:hypothetical protein